MAKHINTDALFRRINEPLCPTFNPRLEPLCLPCVGCSYCQKAHRNWFPFEKRVNAVVPLTTSHLADRFVVLFMEKEEEPALPAKTIVMSFVGDSCLAEIIPTMDDRSVQCNEVTGDASEEVTPEHVRKD